ncbi:MAG: hypothetical protein K5778_10165 [Bacteroidaceae bacterium]|nr:hypothetical protein [Bacteroidaceae bacterium]
MKDETFKGPARAEEMYFKSALDVEETLKKIQEHFPAPGGYYNISDDEYRIKFSKRRLFFCEYNLHCDIEQSDNKYRLQLYYTINNTQWVYWVAAVLYFVFISTTKIFAHGDDSTNTWISIGLFTALLLIVRRFIYSIPAEELRDACQSIKKELGAFIKLELEP